MTQLWKKNWVVFFFHPIYTTNNPGWSPPTSQWISHENCWESCCSPWGSQVDRRQQTASLQCHHSRPEKPRTPGQTRICGKVGCSKFQDFRARVVLSRIGFPGGWNLGAQIFGCWLTGGLQASFFVGLVMLCSGTMELTLWHKTTRFL